MSGRDPLGTALGALWAVGHIAVMTLLGVTVFEHAGGHAATAAVPDMPLTQPDPPLSPDAT
ncbi:hypothetical protein GCM10014715_39550 [Streptomyces spiralis]|uniref:Uncharacterized protein n=1 Tax=Streptomyces spiralis TaxID=66376 RepID=A0A919DUG1_9ACTN|nr:hypothetical protein GCM10014715_39550 [Streptomyces spiralis]